MNQCVTDTVVFWGYPDPLAASYEDGFSTTFWSDFSIADRFGAQAVEDTFRRAFAEWRDDYRYLTDLVLVLNHKIWQHFEGNRALAGVYDRAWKEADEWALDHLTGDELDWFFRCTD